MCHGKIWLSCGECQDAHVAVKVVGRVWGGDYERLFRRAIERGWAIIAESESVAHRLMGDHVCPSCSGAVHADPKRAG